MRKDYDAIRNALLQLGCKARSYEVQQKVELNYKQYSESSITRRMREMPDVVCEKEGKKFYYQLRVEK